MKIKILLSPNTQPIPFNYQEKIVGKFHDLLGDNDLHDSISLYSISMLHKGGRIINGVLDFKHGTSLYISFYDNTHLHKIINSIMKNNEFPFGMNVTSVEFCETPKFNTNKFKFNVVSPVLIRDHEEDNVKHRLFDDPLSSIALTRIMKNKLKAANIDSDVKVYFDSSYKKPKTKLITYRGISNKCTIAPITVEGSPKVLEFAYNVGVGSSTGIGFGCLI